MSYDLLGLVVRSFRKGSVTEGLRLNSPTSGELRYFVLVTSMRDYSGRFLFFDY